MPEDPSECRKHADWCTELAKGAANPKMAATLKDLARQWLKLASDIEAAEELRRGFEPKT